MEINGRVITFHPATIQAGTLSLAFLIHYNVQDNYEKIYESVHMCNYCPFIGPIVFRL
ncbi:hypothetical protein D3C78_1782530 [compost metagenome]